MQAEEIGASDTQTGFIFSVFGASTLLLSPFIGKVVSTFTSLAYFNLKREMKTNLQQPKIAL